MPSLSAAKAFNASFSPVYLPLAIFIGGTSGIGRATAEAFARYTGGNAHIILIGRNQAAADAILASFPKPTPDSAKAGWRHEFIACDTSLMKNIARTTSSLLESLPARKVNFLVISAGYSSLLGRNETEEGIDDQLAVRYYGRWKFISDLLPALRTAAEAGEAAKVMNVLDTIHGGPVDASDFGLRKKYSGMGATTSSLTYTDMAFEEFALRDPEISFTHICPGFVKTPLFTNATHWAMRMFKPVVWAFAVAPDVCAEYMLYALLNNDKGFHRCGEKGDDVGMKSYPYAGSGTKEVEMRQKLWEHTAKEVEVGNK